MQSSVCQGLSPLSLVPWRALLVCCLALLGACLAAPGASAEFGFRQVSFEAREADGTATTQAGSHPFALSATVLFETTGAGKDLLPDGNVRNLRITLPEGLIGTPSALAHCTHPAFVDNNCGRAAALGTVQVLARIEGAEGWIPVMAQVPLYNLDPENGVGAEFGFNPDVTGTSRPLTIRLGVSSQAPHPTFASLEDVPQGIPVLGYRLTLWGDPGAAAHDPYRGRCAIGAEFDQEAFKPLSSGSCPLPERPATALLSMPGSCSPTVAGFEASSWTSPQTSVAAVEIPALAGCEKLGLSADLVAVPTTKNANAPSGLELTFEEDNYGLLSSSTLAGAQLSSAGVSLPVGMAVNPPLVEGLGICTLQQLAGETVTSSGDGCPPASELGTAQVTTPIFESPVEGRLYLAEPDDPRTTLPGIENPFDARFALYLVLRAPEQGVLIIQPILLSSDPRSGQLTASLSRVPQLPITSLKLRLALSGSKPLATPPACGSHDLAYSLQPSSAAAPSIGHSAFSLADNCPTPFKPSLSYQLGSSEAGSTGDLTLQLSATSHEANPATIALSLPPGLSAALGDVPPCPESSTASATCLPTSRIGHLQVAVGAGSDPLWIPADAGPRSDIFLAGPYRGAPFSLLIRLPARAGPFDFGDVVLRAPISLDPESLVASVRLEHLPQILAGVPLRYREIRLVLDRPGLIQNPTSCKPSEITGRATAADGDVARFRDRFQLAACAALPFRPRLALRLSGGVARNGHPALRAVLLPRPGQARIAGLTIALPAGELFDLRRLGALCSPGPPARDCPRDSRLGHLQIQSPLAREPVEGPIYLRRPQAGRLPDLVADLRGGGVHLILHGDLATVGGGRLRLHLGPLPDVPFSKAVIALPGGRRSLLVNSEELCSKRVRVAVAIAAHSGRRLLLRPALRPSGGC